MCIAKNELNSKVAEIRSLKTLKEETENAIKALEHEVINVCIMGLNPSP